MQVKKETIVGTFILTSISVFLYMGYKIDFFKLDKANYTSYYVNFDNASGLTRKAEVRIAGVKVGWVESFNLNEQNNCNVVTKIMILSKYKLGLDTQAYIKQDGIFSIKFIELIPGKQSNVVLKEGQFLNKELSTPQPTIEELMLSVNKVLNETLQVTNSLKNIFVDKEIIYKIKDNLESASLATKMFNNFICQNQEKAESIIKNLYKLGATLPNIVENTDKLISKISDGSDIILDSFKNTSQDNNIKPKNCGLMSYSYLKSQETENKLIDNNTNKKNLFVNSLSEIISGTKTFVNNFNNITLGVDNNYQSFLGINQHKNFESLLNFWIHPNDSFYFLTGATFSKDGFVKQKKINLDLNPKHSLLQNFNSPYSNDQYQNSYDIFKRKTNSFLFNIQTGWYFLNHFGARVGLFRSTPGFALDFYLPIFKGKLKLVSTFEAFDFTGKNHFIKDNKPQLRFMNRLFFAPNFYISFGANDFASSKNTSGFFGIGIDFGDTFFRSKY